MGLSQPPRKTREATPATINILAYSVRKKNDQRMPEYSVWKPATSSDSASGKSKGVRLTSAKPAMKKSQKATKVKGLSKMNQFGNTARVVPVCAATISLKLNYFEIYNSQNENLNIPNYERLRIILSKTDMYIYVVS